MDKSSKTIRDSEGKKRKRDRTIDSFFHKKLKVVEDEVPSEKTRVSVTEINPDPTSPQRSGPTASDTVSTVSLSKDSSAYGSDIGMYVGKVVDLDDFTKCMLLEHPWTPPPNYIFPHCMIKKKKRKETKKYAQRSHLEKFDWLVMSDKDQGLYCKYCVLFIAHDGGGRHKISPLNSFVKVPLRRFDDMLGEQGALRSHEKNLYHQRAIEAGKNFLITYHNPQHDIINQLSTQRHAQIKENRDRLRPIVETIIFCGRQNIALRGHRDSGSLFNNEVNNTQSLVQNDGIFRALLRFRVSAGDKNLEHHLHTASSNATYISNTTQNQLIDCCKDEIQNIILDNVRTAAAYSIIFDETTDVAHIEQLSLSFRYVHKGVIREDFVTFVDAYELIRSEDIVNEERRLTGVALAHIVEDLLKKFSVDITKCVGVGTDSCSVMSSEAADAVQEILKRAINARRCPCNNHMLNNSLSKSSQVVSCRNATGTMKKVIAFANASAKRHAVFKTELGSSLKGLCETRWGEKHDGHLQFRTSLPKICEALIIISKWKDNKTASEAYCLYQTVCSSEFLVSTISLCDVLGTTVSLSRLLQSPSLDLKKAADAVTDTISVLEEERRNANSVFQKLFMEVQHIATDLDVEVKAICAISTQRQRYRENHPAESTEEYFLRAIYIPLLDNILMDLKQRFPDDVLQTFNLRVFLPKKSYSDDERENTVKLVASRYEQILGVPVATVVSEHALWVAKWQRHLDKGSALPDTVVEVLHACDEDMYPSIRLLLNILATLPVSAATAERSFSTLRRLKTWLRSRMREERLTGLALLHVHQDISIGVEKVIDRFAKQKRKLEFVL